VWGSLDPPKLKWGVSIEPPKIKIKNKIVGKKGENPMSKGRKE